jgi:hypothetical protein
MFLRKYHEMCYLELPSLEGMTIACKGDECCRQRGSAIGLDNSASLDAPAQQQITSCYFL